MLVILIHPDKPVKDGTRNPNGSGVEENPITTFQQGPPWGRRSRSVWALTLWSSFRWRKVQSERFQSAESVHNRCFNTQSSSISTRFPRNAPPKSPHLPSSGSSGHPIFRLAPPRQGMAHVATASVATGRSLQWMEGSGTPDLSPQKIPSGIGVMSDEWVMPRRLKGDDSAPSSVSVCF